MSETGKRHVPFARVADAFGVRGHIKVRAYTEKPENLLNYPRWVLDQKANGQQSYAVASSRLHGSFIVAKLEGVDTRDQALELKGGEILIPASDMPELSEGEYYHYQLAGLQVVNSDGYIYGRVKEIMQTGANDVLVVKGAGTCLIPYIPEVILEIDLADGSICVDWSAETQ